MKITMRLGLATALFVPLAFTAACGGGSSSEPSPGGGDASSDGGSRSDGNGNGTDGSGGGACTGSVAGALTASFGCLVSLNTEGSGREFLFISPDSNTPPSVNESIITLYRATGTWSPGTYAASDMNSDTALIVKGTGSTKQFVTKGGASLLPGTSIALVLTMVDPAPPPGTPSLANGTHGTLDAKLAVTTAPDAGAAVTLHVRFELFAGRRSPLIGRRATLGGSLCAASRRTDRERACPVASPTERVTP